MTVTLKIIIHYTPCRSFPINNNPIRIALDVFLKASPSFRKEYITWIADAKTEATRHKRMDQALEWIAEGKGRNWKYERK